MKKILLVGVVLAGIFLVSHLLNKKEGSTTNEGSQIPKTQVQIGETLIDVEVADTPEKMDLGLGERDVLDADYGMLFVYEPKQPAVFWMKGMRFPLDIIWIADGKVVKIDSDVPHEPGVPEGGLKLYPSGAAVDYVLEVNAGFAQRNNINVGDSFIFQTRSYP